MDPLYKINNGVRRCPYNLSHTVQAIRFIGHLLKCAEKSSFKLLVCPWNATHHVHPEHYNIHLSTCESQEMLDGIGEIAVPDSAFVRQYKMMQNQNGCEPKEDTVETANNVMLYHAPINTDHDYAVELHNRRYLIQELGIGDIDEFDRPLVDGSSKFDLFGNLIDKGEVDDLPPGGADSDEESDDLDDDPKNDDPPEDDGPHREADSELVPPPGNPDFWTGSDIPNVMDNRRFYYGNRPTADDSQEGPVDDDRESTTTNGYASDDDTAPRRPIALDEANRFARLFGMGGTRPSVNSPFTGNGGSSYCQRETNDKGTLPLRFMGRGTGHRSEARVPTTLEGVRPTHTPGAASLQLNKDKVFPLAMPPGKFLQTWNGMSAKKKDEPLYTITSLRYLGPRTAHLARRRALTTLEGERPTQALGAGSTQAKKENEVPPGPAGALTPSTATGHGRAYHLQRLYEALKEGYSNNKVSDRVEVPRPSNTMGEGRGRGFHLQRQFEEFQRGNISGRGNMTSTSDPGNP